MFLLPSHSSAYSLHFTLERPGILSKYCTARPGLKMEVVVEVMEVMEVMMVMEVMEVREGVIMTGVVSSGLAWPLCVSVTLALTH